MAKGSRGQRRRIAFRQFRSTPYPLPNCTGNISDLCTDNCSKASDKKDWEDAMCSVCMEFPHNAVLLLCSSHEKGCRPYMCGTSCRYSNCLDQYKKAYTKVTSSLPNNDNNNSQPLSGLAENPIVVSDTAWPIQKSETSELACPLCRGQVKGWTVVEPAREYLNAKKRSCMQENCTFVGTYKELRKHVKAEHPTARPREVDPILEQKWRRLERERERDDVISTIRSTMPGAMVFGDYVIEGSQYGFGVTDEEEERDSDAEGRHSRGLEVGFDSNLVNVFLLLHAFGQRGNVDLTSSRRIRPSPVGGADASDQDNDGNVNPVNADEDDDDDDDGGGNLSLVRRLRRQGRVLLGRAGRRRRHREANGGSS